MKKILLIIFIFIPVIIKASVISGAFINSKTDISGNLIVEEIIELDEYDKPVNIYYKNELKDKIYESSGIKLNKIGILEKENISKFYDENFEENYIKEINNCRNSEIKIPKSKNKLNLNNENEKITQKEGIKSETKIFNSMKKFRKEKLYDVSFHYYIHKLL